jgi:hypothetical protein
MLSTPVLLHEKGSPAVGLPFSNMTAVLLWFISGQ